MRKTHLLIIDPQYDFCVPGVYDAVGNLLSGGSLYVDGAVEDMNRLATFIGRVSRKITKIHVTLDSHQDIHIAHAIYWVGKNSEHPNPFTIITADDVRKGVWRPTAPALKAEVLAYVETLEKGGRYPLCIWPEHCIINTLGATAVVGVSNAVRQWSKNRFSTIDYVTKGSNYKCEHYSAVKAEVPDPSDPSTDLNTNLIDVLETADEILIAGEALSHCVANTVRDIANSFGNTDYIKKLTLLLDCSSPVAGPNAAIFAGMATDFLIEMGKKGMRAMNSVDWNG